MRESEITIQQASKITTSQAVDHIRTTPWNEFTYSMIEILGAKLLEIFKFNGWGNPFNYNRFFEFVQAKLHGFVLTTVGGGSDGVRENDPTETAEFKAAEFKGFKKDGKPYSLSCSYNGTSRFEKWEEDQEPYCINKIMRDLYHYWDFFDYGNCDLRPIFSIKIRNTELLKILLPKWKKSWENTSAKDSRIGASISIVELEKSGIEYEIVWRDDYKDRMEIN